MRKLAIKFAALVILSFVGIAGAQVLATRGSVTPDNNCGDCNCSWWQCCKNPCIGSCSCSIKNCVV